MLALLILLPAVARLNRPRDAWLTDNELTNITSVDCLRKLHAGVGGSADCGGETKTEEVGNYRIGNFPRYDEPRCGQVVNKTALADTTHNTAGDYQPFCDPDGLLSAEERKTIELALFNAWTVTRIQCGVPGSNRVDDSIPFRLGVAIVRTLPIAEQDPKSLEMFGSYVLETWGLLDAHGGGMSARKDGIANGCPDTALLVFVAEPYQRALVVAPNCDVICMERNGDSVATAAKVGWERSLSSAVLKAIGQTQRVVAHSVENGTHPFSHQPADAYFQSWLRREDVIVDGQRALLAGILLAGLALLVAMFRCAFNMVVTRAVWDVQKDFSPGYVDDNLIMRRHGGLAAHFGRAR